MARMVGYELMVPLMNQPQRGGDTARGVPSGGGLRRRGSETQRTLSKAAAVATAVAVAEDRVPDPCIFHNYYSSCLCLHRDNLCLHYSLLFGGSAFLGVCV